MPCSRAIMRNVSFDNIDSVDAWSRTTQYGDDKPVHPDALPESYVDVGRWRDYKWRPCHLLSNVNLSLLVGCCLVSPAKAGHDTDCCQSVIASVLSWTMTGLAVPD